MRLTPLAPVIATLIGTLGSLFLFTQTQGINRFISLITLTPSVVFFFQKNQTKEFQKTQTNPPDIPQQIIQSSLEKHYQFSWTIGDADTSKEFSGFGRAFDFGDRIIFIQQDSQTAGSYIMDLKVSGDSVSGVWWYVGGALPQGTYRGQITQDGIQGIWHSPDGSRSGDWNFSLIKDDAPQEKT